MVPKKLWAVVLIVIACSISTNIGLIGYFFYQNEITTYKNNNQSQIVTENIKKRGIIRLGTSPDYPPFESITSTSNGLEVTGFDIELAKLLVANLSTQLGAELSLTIEAAFFNALMAGLKSDSYDIVIAAFAIRPERKLEVDFSVPYYFSQQCCLVPVSDTTIHDKYDLTGKHVAVQTGTSGESLASGLMCIPTAFPTVDNIMLDLQNGNSDAAIMDIPVAQHFALGGNVKIAFNFTDVEIEGFGVAMTKGAGQSAIMGIINGTIITLNNTGLLHTLFKA
jgi:ABC-type amino acid transport substrate-binding protein